MRALAVAGLSAFLFVQPSQCDARLLRKAQGLRSEYASTSYTVGDGDQAELMQLYKAAVAKGAKSLTVLAGETSLSGKKNPQSDAAYKAHYAEQGVRGGVGKYGNKIDACKNCVTYYPHQVEGESPDGYNHWEKTCYSGRCNFDVPWITGPQDESCGDGVWKCWYWGLQEDSGANWCNDPIYGTAMSTVCKKTCGRCDPSQDQTKYCFSLDPIEWYDECPALLWNDVQNVMDVARVCEYDHQIQVMTNPNLWNGQWTPFKTYEIAGRDELNCQAVIQDGWMVYKDDDSFDSAGDDPLPLDMCCERVHMFFTCMGAKQEVVQHDASGLNFLDSMSYGMINAFKSYCVPLFQFPTKPAFCGVYPTSDPCVTYYECEPCTTHGGTWCANQGKCNHKAMNGCDTAHTKPTQCASYLNRHTVTTTTTTIITTTVPTVSVEVIPRTPHWFWNLVHGGHVYAANYYPNETIGVKQGEPPMFRPYHGNDHPAPKRQGTNQNPVPRLHD